MLRLVITPLALAAVVGAAPASAQPVLNTVIAAPNDDLELRNRDLVVRDQSDTVRARIDSASGDISLHTEGGKRSFHLDQPGANLFLGGGGGGGGGSGQANDDGDVVIFSETAASQQTGNASIHLDGGGGRIFLGGGGETGQMVLREDNGAQRLFFDAGDATAIIGNGDELGPPGSGRRGRLELRDASGEATATIDGAAGRIRANQIVSRANGQGGTQGIDSASVYVESPDPALGFRDTSGGNQQGWYVQAGSTGRLQFQAGTTSGLGATVLVLEADGGVCLGACD